MWYLKYHSGGILSNLILHYNILLCSLHYAKSSLKSIEQAFWCCAPLSMLGRLGRTSCDEVHFPVHSGWNSRDVSMTGMYDQRECEYNDVVSMLVIF